MQTTTNLNLKKPEPGDYALVSDINDNMDTLDTKVADVRDSTVSFTDADLDTGITSFPTFLSKIVSGMKLAKFLRDFKAGMGYVLHVGSLVNNATCTESGKALDARMGKTLQDQITSLNDSLGHFKIVGSGVMSTYSFDIPSQISSFFLIFMGDANNGALFGVAKKTNGNSGVFTIFNSIPSRFSATISGNTVTIKSESYGAMMTVMQLY